MIHASCVFCRRAVVQCLTDERHCTRHRLLPPDELQVRRRAERQREEEHRRCACCRMRQGKIRWAGNKWICMECVATNRQRQRMR